MHKDQHIQNIHNNSLHTQPIEWFYFHQVYKHNLEYFGRDFIALHVRLYISHVPICICLFCTHVTILIDFSNLRAFEKSFEKKMFLKLTHNTEIMEN